MCRNWGTLILILGFRYLEIFYSSISIDHISGADSHRELHVRLFFRRVFIDQARNMEEKAFWLDLILKSLPMVHQAKVLFLLFGPVATGTLPKILL